MSDCNEVSQKELLKAILSEEDEAMCGKIFDFKNDVDNGWSVSTQDNPLIATRNSDGKQFIVKSGGDEAKVNDSKLSDNADASDISPLSHQLEGFETF